MGTYWIWEILWTKEVILRVIDKLVNKYTLIHMVGDIIDHTVRDNLVVFTYDDVNIKYVMEICN